MTSDPNVLACDGFVLRPWAPGDEDSVVHHGDDRRIWRNLTDKFPHPYTHADAVHWITSQQELQDEIGFARNFAIAVDGEAVGGAGFEPYTDLARRGAEVGYWLGHAFWGRGIATAALARLTDHVFATTEIVRLQASVLEWNPASRRVLEKCGYSLECRLRKSITKDGELIDSLLYAKVKPGV